jgi:hypothetical protein
MKSNELIDIVSIKVPSAFSRAVDSCLVTSEADNLKASNGKEAVAIR